MADPDPWAAARGVLLGRARELGTIANRYRAAASEGMQVVRVAGEPGAGKSALLAAVAQSVVADGGRVARARGDASAAPFSPVARVVRLLAEGTDTAELRRALGFDAGPVLGLAPELRDPEVPPPERLSFDVDRVADGLRRLLTWLTADQPVAVLVDDAANLDPASRSLLRNLVADPPSAGALLVVAEREEPEDEPALGDGSWATALRLGPLTPDELSAVVERETAFRPSPALLEELVIATGGNPGFALEVVRQGDPARLGQGAQPIASPSAEALARRRVHRLGRLPGPDGIDDRLRAAAVLGDELDLELLETVTGTAPGGLAGTLTRAEGARVVERAAGPAWRFTAGARSVLAAGLDDVEAARLHRAAASTLLERHGESAGDDADLATKVATHLLAAAAPGEPLDDEAVRWICLAADLADEAGQPGATTRLLRRANELVSAAPADQRARIGTRLGRALWATDGARAARLVFSTAAAAARAAAASDRIDHDTAADLLTDAAVGYARTIDRAGPPDAAASRLLDEALERRPDHAAAEACRALLTSDDHRRADLVGRALDHADRPRAAALAHLAEHATHWGAGAGAERLAAADRAVEAAEAAGDTALVLDARRRRHADLLIAGDRHGADAELAAILDRAERAPHAGTAWHVPALRAARAQLDGRIDHSILRLGQARDAAAGSDPGPARAVAVGLALARPPADERPIHGLLAEVDELLDQRPESPLWHAARARVLVEQGLTEEARSVVTRFVVDQPSRIPVDADWLPTLALLATTVVALGDPAGAAALEHALEPWAGQVVVWSPWGITWSSVDALLGELAAVDGRLDVAIERLAAAVALETALGAPALANRSRVRMEGLRAAVEAGAGAADAPADSDGAGTGVGARDDEAAALPAAGLARESITTNVRCFGGFHLEVAGQAIDLAGLTPRLRTLAWFLAAHADEVVHTEKVIDALWPEADLTSGRRNLQVAVSGLRQAVEPGARRGGWVVLAREGEGYRLVLGQGRSDLRDFELAAATARRDRDVAAAERALALYGGDIIPEAGAATWLVERRDACNRAAADLALFLAEDRLAAGDPAAAIEACERGLTIDRYEDGLWKTLIAAAEAKGDRAVAARAQKDYEAVLEDLGL